MDPAHRLAPAGAPDLQIGATLKGHVLGGAQPIVAVGNRVEGVEDQLPAALHGHVAGGDHGVRRATTP